MKEYEYSREAYYYGSEAPQRVPSPERKKRNLSVREARELQAEENQRSATAFGPIYTMIILAAVAVMAFCGVGYIKAQSAHTANTKTISSLQAEVEELAETNREKKLVIDTAIDYDYIYRVAVKELGMVYPGEGQIVTYDSGESEYVIQYNDFD